LKLDSSIIDSGMSRVVLTLGFVVVCTLGVVGQNLNAVKVDWRLYTNASEDFTVMFPKLPVKDDTSDICKNQNSTSYVAYAEEVVYKVKLIRKSREKGASWCTERETFDETFFKRLGRKVGATFAKAKNGLEFFEYKEGSTRYWVFDDLARERLIELSVVDRDASKTDHTRFVDSFRPWSVPDAMAIGSGAAATLGDLTEATRSTETEPQPTTSADAPYIAVHQPRANYTEEARKKGIEGNVLLKILLLPNGSVGSVTPVSQQPYGLTEQAIWAARKIVFLPKVKDGKRVAIIILREYAFGIY
jgi:TonB family protein